jgi:hypothetical protein
MASSAPRVESPRPDDWGCTLVYAALRALRVRPRGRRNPEPIGRPRRPFRRELDPDLECRLPTAVSGPVVRTIGPVSPPAPGQRQLRMPRPMPTQSRKIVARFSVSREPSEEINRTRTLAKPVERRTELVRNRQPQVANLRAFGQQEMAAASAGSAAGR